MNKISNFINPNLLITAILFNYFFYFFFKTNYLFYYFGFFVVAVFLFLIFYNIKKNPYLIIVILILSFITLASPVSDWDSRSIWLFNSKRIFFNNNLDEYVKYFYAPNIDYPIVIQTLSASLARLIGGWNEIFPKFSSIIISLPPLLIFSSITKSKLDKLLLIILILFIYEKKLINGDMDSILSLYVISSSILLINFANKEKNLLSDYYALFLNLTMITLIKIEGLGLFFCIIFSFMLVFYNYKNPKFNKILIVFLISLIPIILWRIYIYDQNIISSSYLMLSNGERFFKNLTDFKFILTLFKYIFFNKQMFISFTIFLLFISKYIYINKDSLNIKINSIILEKKLIYLYFCILTYFTVLLSIYILSEGSPNNVKEIYFMSKTTTDRYFLPVHSLLILCSIYLSNKKNNSNNV